MTCTAYIIAKRYAYGDLIAYLCTDDDGNEDFKTRDKIAATFIPDRIEAELVASDWADYWQSKGYGYTATVETITEEPAQ